MSKTRKIHQAYQSGNYKYQDLANRVGMLIPPHIEDPEKYFLDNLDSYESVLNRNPSKTQFRNTYRMCTMLDNNEEQDNQIREELDQFTDSELMALFGCYVLYNGRKHLINKLLETLCGNEYFVLLVDNDKTKTHLIIRRGNINIRSTAYSTENTASFSDLSQERILRLQEVRSILEIYAKEGRIVNKALDVVNEIIEKKRKWMINILPCSSRWM